MDTIASCAFGVDARSFSEEEETEFVLNAKNVFRLSAVEMVKFMALALLPFVATFYTTMKWVVLFGMRHHIFPRNKGRGNKATFVYKNVCVK